MPELRYVIPVIAHRLYGWRLEHHEVSPPREIPRARMPWDPGLTPGLIPELISRSRLGAPRPHRRELDRTVGTARSSAEIEALFTPDAALTYTAGITVQDYFAAADIGFELIAIADHIISPWLAELLPGGKEPCDELALQFNVPRALNLYLVKDIRGAWGRAYPTDPDEQDDVVGYAFVSDRYVEGEPVENPERWRADVITAAHELGHALGLLHRADSTNLMYGYGTTSTSTGMELAQHRICEYYARRYNRSVYPPDSVPILVAPRANEFPSF